MVQVCRRLGRNTDLFVPLRVTDPHGHVIFVTTHAVRVTYCMDEVRRARGQNLPTPTTNAAPSAAAT